MSNGTTVGVGSEGIHTDSEPSVAVLGAKGTGGEERGWEGKEGVGGEKEGMARGVGRGRFQREGRGEQWGRERVMPVLLFPHIEP